MTQYMKLVEAYEAVGTTLYYSPEAALQAWIDEYLPLSEEYEYVTLLYGIQTTLGPRYHTSRTIRGTKKRAFMEPNVILGTLILAAGDQLSTAILIAHVHTHPCPDAGYHNDFPSTHQNGLGGDQLAYELLGFPEMYIIPYKRCKGTPAVIVFSDKSTWCNKYE